MRLAIFLADLTTAVVAWWGAALATIVFLWDVYKWQTTGARIRMIVKPGMKVMGDPELEGKTLIIIHATNVGERPTTLECLAIAWYANWWKRIRRKPKEQFGIKNPGWIGSFPCKLEVGERWDGRTYQTEEIVEMANTGHLVFEMHHASSKRPAAKRLLINRAPGTTAGSSSTSDAHV